MKNVRVLNENEMKVVNGGSVDFPADMKFLDKDECLDEAQSLLDNGTVKNMTQKQIAEEIYAHAILYCGGIGADALEEAFKDYSPLTSVVYKALAEYLIEHAEIINISDGGDTYSRRLAYSIIWKVF